MVREEIDAAVRLLRGAAERDEAIHEARKAMKKIRAALRLVRDGMGGRFERENERFRELGRQLSGLRDAGALIEIFGRIEKAAGAPLAGVRAGFNEYKRRCEVAANPAEVMESVARALAEARAEMVAWPVTPNGFAAFERGLRRTLGDTRRAWRAAANGGGAEEFHEWRKRAKDHWHHLKLLEGMGRAELREYTSRVKRLEQHLGEEHNVHVLGLTIAAQAELFPAGAERELLEKSAAALSERLRRAACETAARLLRPKPGEFIELANQWWEAWRGERARRWVRRVGAGNRLDGRHIE